MKVWNVMNGLKCVVLIAKNHKGPQYLGCKLEKEQQIKIQIRNFDIRMFYLT
jgi:hypothetical protein